MILTETMPCWYYEKKDLRNTPSIREGLDFDAECRNRKEGTRFIMECGTAMLLGHNTIATGAMYFHRFYMFHTFQEFPRYVTACCCLFLAGKVEETPKKCRDIIATARSMLTDVTFQSFSEDLRKAKEEVMTMESILLQTIKFDLEVEHPYNFLLTYVKCLKGDKAKLQRMVQMAWNFVNDSLSTTVCLQWEPEIIAVALIHLASKLSKFSASDWYGRQANHLRWWDMFISDVTMEILEDICHQVLDLYQQPNHQHPIENSSAASSSHSTKSSPTAKSTQSPQDKTVSPKNSALSVVSSIASSQQTPQPPPPPLPISVQTTTNTMATKIRDKRDVQAVMPMSTSGDINIHYAYPPYNGMYAHSVHYSAPTPPIGNAIITPAMYPAHPYPQPPMMPNFIPQCGQQPPNYYNHPPPNRISGGYYPGPS